MFLFDFKVVWCFVLFDEEFVFGEMVFFLWLKCEAGLFGEDFFSLFT